MKQLELKRCAAWRSRWVMRGSIRSTPDPWGITSPTVYRLMRRLMIIALMCLLCFPSPMPPVSVVTAIGCWLLTRDAALPLFSLNAEPSTLNRCAPGKLEGADGRGGGKLDETIETEAGCCLQADTNLPLIHLCNVAASSHRLLLVLWPRSVARS